MNLPKIKFESSPTDEAPRNADVIAAARKECQVYIEKQLAVYDRQHKGFINDLENMYEAKTDHMDWILRKMLEAREDEAKIVILKQMLDQLF